MITLETVARLEPKDCTVVKGTLRQTYDVMLNGNRLTNIHIGSRQAIEKHDWLTGKSRFIFGIVESIDRITGQLTICDAGKSETMSIDEYVDVAFGS